MNRECGRPGVCRGLGSFLTIDPSLRYKIIGVSAPFTPSQGEGMKKLHAGMLLALIALATVFSIATTVKAEGDAPKDPKYMPDEVTSQAPETSRCM